MPAHRPADVYRWAVMRRVAQEFMRGASPKAGVTTRRVGRTEITTVSAASGNVEAMKGIARKRSSKRHG